MCSSSSRARFSSNLSRKFNIEPSRIQKDLLKILVYLEDQRSKLLGVKEDDKQKLTEEERQIGINFLKSPGLFDQITADMETLGYVGEEINKKLIYLVATSRKMDDPISLIIVSQSGSGKSYLVDTVEKLIPDEDVVESTSNSEQALNYLEAKKLLHKFFIFGEAMHSEIIEHQIRDMLSGHKLSRMVTIKDDKTGQLITKNIKKDVIIASVISTTKNNINPENAGRCFLVNTDESVRQTKRIHEKQKGKYSLERHFDSKYLIPEIIKKHYCAQKLFTQRIIVNPFADYLDFPDSLMRTRRDFDRFIDLIAVVCFVRQFQKEVKKTIYEKIGEQVEYIECDLFDYKIAYQIITNILPSTLVDFPKSAVILYDEIRKVVSLIAKEKGLKPEEINLTQRLLREKTNFNHMFIKRYLKMLVEYEYIKTNSQRYRGNKSSYSLICDEKINLIDLSRIPTPDQMERLINQKDEA